MHIQLPRHSGIGSQSDCSQQRSLLAQGMGNSAEGGHLALVAESAALG
jgi:hypothetical protein